jgi:hypothetical protein
MFTNSTIKWGHLAYKSFLALIVVVITFWLAFHGYDFYHTPLEERFYHPDYQWFKASGLFGHGLGIIGTILIAVGVFFYIPAKKYGFLEPYIRLRYLLEFHIFLCALGPILVLFHTTFKFGGIVSVAFWSMVLVVLSGVAGRYIYLQIPRTISGKEISRKELLADQETLLLALVSLQDAAPELYHQLRHFENPKKGLLARWLFMRKHLRHLKKNISRLSWTSLQRRKVFKVIKAELRLRQRIERLELMQRLFKYWHVVHRPFALIMLIIVMLHVFVTVGMGYTWIF